MRTFILLILALICLQGNELYAKSNDSGKDEIKDAEKIIGRQGEGKTFVTIKTSEGTIEVMLYDETPRHRDNFIKLAESGFYDGVLFHRSIKNFMIQGGDPRSKESLATIVYGASSNENDIEAEINDKFFPHKGALAAARMPDQFNPEKRSSESQFFIVHGRQESDSTLVETEEMLGTTIPADRKEVYKTIGGVPQLDGEYTIFGRVTKGLNVVDRIAGIKTDRNDRPMIDVYIQRTTVRTKK